MRQGYGSSNEQDEDESITTLGHGATIGAGVMVPIGAKALFFFRDAEAVRPYAGVGVGFMDSKRRSVFPTFTLGPGSQVIPGPPEIFRYHTTGGTLGFAVGMDARLIRHLSLLGDLTLDLGSPEALASTRVTVGAGWRF